MADLAPYYHIIKDHYENCFAQYGATHKGVDWPNAQDHEIRFKVMLNVIKPTSNDQPVTLLDLGCGYGALLNHLKKQVLDQNIQYFGIDLSTKLIEQASQLHGAKFFKVQDILVEKLDEDLFDYGIMNGLFTEKRSLTQVQMEEFFTEMIKTAFKGCRVGMAFNIMNFHVDWYRDELFYLPFDRMAAILKQHCTRHYMIRADYGLYEYTVYAYK